MLLWLAIMLCSRPVLLYPAELVLVRLVSGGCGISGAWSCVATAAVVGLALSSSLLMLLGSDMMTLGSGGIRVALPLGWRKSDNAAGRAATRAGCRSSDALVVVYVSCCSIRAHYSSCVTDDNSKSVKRRQPRVEDVAARLRYMQRAM